MSAKYSLENDSQSTEIDLKTEVQTGSVTGDIYKTFWKSLKGSENEFPPEVKWIKACWPWNPLQASRRLAECRRCPETHDAATNARDKALISVLYDSGRRIGERLTLRTKSVEFDDSVPHVNGKTGPRLVQIIHSVSDW